LNASRKHHALECETLKAIREKKIAMESTNIIRLMIRILTNRANEHQLSVKTKDRKKSSKICFSDVCDLISHKERLPPQAIEEFRAVVEALRPVLHEAVLLPNDEHYLDLLMRIQCNAHSLYGAEDRSVYGFALFPVASMVNHSCTPNSFWTFVPQPAGAPIMEFRGITDIKTGQQIVYSYVNQYLPSLSRQQILLGSYFFMCDCRRCLEDKDDLYIDGLRCPKCAGPLYGGTCISCCFKIAEVDSKAYDEAADSVAQLARECSELLQTDPKACLAKLKGSLESECVQKLHQCHFLLLDMYFMGSRCARMTSDWESLRLFSDLALKCLENEKLSFPLACSPEVASIYTNLVESYLKLNASFAEDERYSKEVIHECFNKVLRIREICFGKSSDIYSRTKKSMESLGIAIDPESIAKKKSSKTKSKNKKKR